MKSYLNLGCGYRFHPAWTNVDFTSTGPNIIAHNLTEGTHFANNSFEVIYHSHVLEHFSRSQALSFLQECYRILRPNGILRIAVPDMEQITRSYIFALEQAVVGSKEAAHNYNWLLLELFDQMARNYSGGEMAAYLQQEHIPNESFILKRLGIEAENLINAGFHNRHSNLLLNPWYKRVYRSINHFLKNPNLLREIFLKQLLSKKEYQALKIGRFRQSGEVHQWMYDRYSLAVILKKCRFEKIIQRSATESYISNWNTYNLDTEPDGSIYKPDSFYMEAVKSGEVSPF